MFDNKTIGERFADLRKSKKDNRGKDMPVIQLAQELSNKKHIKDYEVDVIRQEIGKVENKGKFPQLFLIKGYCGYFKVTSDYLLGIRDTKPVDENIAMISKTTGLSENAIEALKIIKRSSYINTLNFIMRDYALLGAFLSNIELYLNNKFDTPVHFDDRLEIFVESKDVSDRPVLISSNEKYVSIGKKLDYEVDGQAAFEALSVPVSILESHALHCIQQLLDDWKKEYKKGND